MIKDGMLLYLAVVNIIAFLMFGWDKRKAKMSGFRIPERTLLSLAVIGGSLGAYGGMKIFHHKTRHVKFRIGIPLIFLIQLILLYLVKASLR